MKQDTCNLCFYNVVRYLKFLAELLYGSKIKRVISQIDGDCRECEFLRIKASESGKRVEESERVLATGNTDRNMIALLNEFIIVNPPGVYSLKVF